MSTEWLSTSKSGVCKGLSIVYSEGVLDVQVQGVSMRDCQRAVYGGLSTEETIPSSRRKVGKGVVIVLYIV